MFYITALVSNQHVNANHAVDAIRFLYGLVPTDPADEQRNMVDYPRTWTREVSFGDVPGSPAGYDTWFTILLGQIRNFRQRNPDPATWYQKFFIPKASGGFREINAPIEELKQLQRQITYQLSHIPNFNLPVVHPHDAAYAYIAKRSTKHAMEEHQRNGSNWFLKLDVKDFFPSCTKDLVVEQLSLIYPLCYIAQADLREIIDVCCLNGVLPQGAPTSPFLTNMLMLPLDKAISDIFFNWNRRRHVYTRYADDILISSREQFDWTEAQGKVADILSQYGFAIKREKTRYGSRAGRNWNLGIMLNKDNNLTLGHKHKQRMRAAVFSFLKDYQAHNPWDASQTQVLVGQLSYLESIEPGYKEYMIQHYEQKLNVSFRNAVRNILN